MFTRLHYSWSRLSEGQVFGKKLALAGPRSRGPIPTLLAFMLVVGVCSCGKKPPYENKSAAELEAMLRDDDPKVQAQGAYGLSLDRSQARQAVPELIKSLKSKDALVRQHAALALGRAGPDASSAVPALIAALEDSSWPVQRQAILALGAIGAKAHPAVETLTSLSNEGNRAIRAAAQKALRQINPGGE
jgi:HEAT repeat protein